MFQTNTIHPSSFQRTHLRRGTTTVEAALGLAVVCTIIIGFMDFSIASFRSQVLNHVAHRIARSAIVHGSYASANWQGGIWGPESRTLLLADDDPVAEVGRQLSSGLRSEDISIEIQWPNGSTSPGNPVLVETRMDWSPMLFSRFGFNIMTLRGRSSQVIQH